MLRVSWEFIYSREVGKEKTWSRGREDERLLFLPLVCCLFATRVPNRQLLLMLNFSLYVCSTVKSHLERLFQACFDNSPLGIRLKAGILLS